MRQLGLAHESTSLAGRMTTLVSHPLTVGRALARRATRLTATPGVRRVRVLQVALRGTSLGPRITLAFALLAAVLAFDADAVQTAITLCHEGFEIR